MRTSVRLASLSSLAVLLTFAAPALADEPAASAPAPAPEPLPAAPPPTDAAPPAPAPSALPPSAPPAEAPRADAEVSPDKANDKTDTRRAEGIRLGLELGFMRAFSGANERLNAGTPSAIPLGAALSFRTSPSLLLGFHGYAALASRDDCISADSCRARAYAFGGHIETPLSKGPSFVWWFRYAVNYEILYQGGAPLDPAGHVFRDAFDFLDARIGGDFIVHRGSEGRTARIGPYAGLVAGVLTNQTGVSNVNGSSGVQPRNLERSSGSSHLWFSIGVRGTIDP